MRAHERGDEADLHAVPSRRLGHAAGDRLRHLPPRQAAGRVEERCPPDLGVVDVVEGLVLDQVGGGVFDGLGVLHQLDRQVEGEQELRLVLGLLGTDEDGAHGPVRVRRVDAAGPGDVERGLHAERAVQVEVELGLGHGPDEGAEGARIEFGHARMVGLRARAVVGAPSSERRR